jgi:DNA-binding transcriptional LysR family regulator
MERLNEMITFARVVETKSFSAAALVLGTSKSMVSKQVSQLEHALGVRLLNRTTRSMSLTEIGSAYYEHCARIAQEIDAAGQTVSQLQVEPRGVLRMTTPVVFASLHLAPALKSFIQRYPQVEVELNASDRLVDVVEEGYDLAIRITSNPIPTMVARKLAAVRWVTCAAPEYLAEHGTPQAPQDLLQHQCLTNPGQSGYGSGWRYWMDGREQVVNTHGSFRVTSSDVLIQLALGGMGLVLFPTYMVGQYLRSGRLVEVLADCVAYPNATLVATYMPNRYLQPKVRAFIDHLLETFGPEPYWDRY